MIDLHCHLLPYVDDGSESIEESIEMIRMYKRSGYSGAVCTSHYYPEKYAVTREQVLESIAALQEELLRQELTFDLYPGNEIFLDVQTPKVMEENRAASLNGSRYLLLELPFLTKPNYARDLIYRLQLNGYIAVLAHCERYSYVQDDPEWLLELIKIGCLIQVNIGSISSNPGGRVFRTLETLLDSGMVHLIATDAHGSSGRSPAVETQLAAFQERMGEEWFQRIAVNNPKKVIQNQFISSGYDRIMMEKTEEPKKKKGFFQKLFGRH